MADEKEKLESTLQCRVCFEDYKIDDKIWQCKSGHSICTPCRNHISECPFCKAPYQGTRNYIVEEIVRELNEKGDEGHGGNNLSIEPSAPDQEDGGNSSLSQPIARDQDDCNFGGNSSSSQPNAPDQKYDYFGGSNLSTQPNAPDPEDVDFGGNNTSTNLIAPEIDNYDTVPIVEPDTFQAVPDPVPLDQSKIPQDYLNFTTDTSDEFRDTLIVNAATVSLNEEQFQNVWIDCNSYVMPSNMITGGRDYGNTPLYIGRASHGSAIIPGKVRPGYGACYVAWGGEEYEKRNFQVLTNVSGTWLPNSGGTIPKEAFPGGYTENKEILYIGRAPVEGTLAIGKVQPSHGCCYVTYGGKEYAEEDYEIFVLCP